MANSELETLKTEIEELRQLIEASQKIDVLINKYIFLSK